MNGAANEQLSSASIFEHVDRMSRATDASRRLPNKVQLIAMQPMPVPPLHSQPVNGKPSDPNQMNKEVKFILMDRKIHLPKILPTCPPIYLPTYLLTYLPNNLPTNQPVYLPTHLPTYVASHPPTYQPTKFPMYPSTLLPT